jgi:hypothetical protein
VEVNEIRSEVSGHRRALFKFGAGARERRCATPLAGSIERGAVPLDLEVTQTREHGGNPKRDVGPCDDSAELFLQPVAAGALGIAPGGGSHLRQWDMSEPQYPHRRDSGISDMLNQDTCGHVVTPRRPVSVMREI